MNEWENKKVHGYHISRYIASWQNAGGNVFEYLFVEWLRQIKPDGTLLDETEVDEILFIARIGRLEFESDARDYLKKHSHKRNRRIK